MGGKNHDAETSNFDYIRSTQKKKALVSVVIYNYLWLAVQMSVDGKMPRNSATPHIYPLTVTVKGAPLFQLSKARWSKSAAVLYVLGNERF